LTSFKGKHGFYKIRKSAHFLQFRLWNLETPSNGLVAQAEIGVYIARSSAFTRQSAALVPCRLKAELQTGQFADASYFTSVLQNRSMRSKPFSRFAMLVA
jgi:hypothetical protein